MNDQTPILSPMGRAALDLARQGLPVFPCAQDKRPLVARGFLSASTDPETIKAWWRLHPDAMIGVPTGPLSGLFVIDCDIDKETGVTVGEITLAQSGHEDLLTGPGCYTQSGGLHLYFRDPGDLVRNSAGKIGPKVDTRGAGGYVIVPPSRGAGGAYRHTGPIDWSNLPDVPDDLLQRLLKRPEAPAPVAGRAADEWADKALQGEVGRVFCAPAGERNSALNRAAFSLGQIVAGGGLPDSLVRDRLRAAALQVGLDPQETEATVESGLQAGYAQPRRPRLEDGPRGPHHGQGGQIINPGAPARTSAFFSAATLAGRPVPERQWLVADMIPMGTVTLFTGDGGTGKSLLALQAAVAVVAGTSWLERQPRQGRALFMSAEDDHDELHRRLDDVLRAAGRGYGDVAGLTIRSLAGENALLASESPFALVETELFRELEARADDDKPDLIVIDTLADVYPANENDRAKVRQFVGILRGLAIRHRCAVMLLGHPSLTGLSDGSGRSGSTAWHNSVRARLYLSRVLQDGYEADSRKRVLSTKKQNYGATGGEIAMTWQDGVFVPDGAETGLDRMAGAAKAERVFLRLLRLLSGQGRKVNTTGGQTYAPNVFAAHPDSEGLTKRALKAAMESLLQKGVIRMAEDGPASKRRTFLEVAE
jgi:RecA-family ATPase